MPRTTQLNSHTIQKYEKEEIYTQATNIIRMRSTGILGLQEEFLIW